VSLIELQSSKPMLGRDHRKQFEPQTKIGAFVGVVFGLVFFGIGLTVIVFMWSGEGFGAPPLFFRIFASLIATCFVAVGGAVAYGSIRALASGNAVSLPTAGPTSLDPQTGSPVNYVCPACGAPLAERADVSPKGDVKCSHCGRWFNIHEA
jgi:hypothetical protein